MRTLICILLSIVLITGVLLLPAIAEEHKLTRGPKNIALGWTEVPNTIVAVTKQSNNPLLGITVGLVKGVLNAFARTTSGVWDVATCAANSKGKADIKPQMVDVKTEK